MLEEVLVILPAETFGNGAQDDEDFLEHVKLEMFQDQVFCFTPKGEVVKLPRGATAIDFAYADAYPDR